PQGNWVGTYGADGYALLGWTGTSDLISMPRSSLILDQGGRYQWGDSTTEVSSLQSLDSSNRQAACFFDNIQLRVHLVFPAAYSATLDSLPLDGGTLFRAEPIPFRNATG